MPPESSTMEPPVGAEVKMSQLGKRGITTPLPDGILAEANRLAGKQHTPAQDEPEALAPPETPVPATNGPQVKPAHELAPPVVPAAVPDKPKKGIEELREAHEKALSRLRELDATDQTKSKTLKDAQDNLAKLQEAVAKYEREIKEVYEPSRTKLGEAEKRLAEREETIRLKDYTASQEWHEKHVKPLADARADTEQLMAELVMVRDGDERPATMDDFSLVLSAPNLTEATRRANTLFGPEVAQTVVNQRNRIVSLERQRQGALKNAQIESEEFHKRQQTQMAENRKALQNKLIAESERIMAAEAGIFKPAEDDKESADALSEGFRLADLSMLGDPSLTQDEFVGVVAKARSSIGKAFVLEKRMAKVAAENAVLREQLKGYQKSEPDVQGRNGGTPQFGSDKKDDARASLLEAAQKLASKLG